jgi:hypothetical protein
MTLVLEFAEGVFTFASAVGALFAFVNFLDARRDWLAVRSRNGGSSPTLRLVARRDVRSSGTGAVGFVLFAASGTLFHLFGLVGLAAWLLVAGVLVLTGNLVADARVRAEVLLLVDEACDDGVVEGEWQ